MQQQRRKQQQIVDEKEINYKTYICTFHSINTRAKDIEKHKQYEELARSGKKDSGNMWVRVYYNTTEGKKMLCAGTHMPIAPKFQYKLYGYWEDSKNFDPTFQVIHSETLLPDREQGVVDYLVSLNIGIGYNRAKSIFDKYGKNIWNILEDNPNMLTTVDGVDYMKVNRLVTRMSDILVERQVITLFAGIFDLTPHRLKSIKNQLGLHDLYEKISEDPYSLTLLNGFDFYGCDRLAKRLGYEATDIRRIAAAANDVFDKTSSKGHVCYPAQKVLQSVVHLVNGANKSIRSKSGNNIIYPSLSTQEIKDAINKLCVREQFYGHRGYIYSAKNYQHETGIILEIVRLMTHPARMPWEEDLVEEDSRDTSEVTSTGKDRKEVQQPSDQDEEHEIPDVEQLISAYEQEIGNKLAEGQRNAVLTAMDPHNTVTIVTGGPGTGKSTVIRAVLWVHKQIYGEKHDPVLMAPTGRAARRMTEATGYDAATIHHVIKYTGEEEPDDQYLKGNLFIVDEASMVDQYIGLMLLKKIPDHARIIFVGDPDQLPSVGCGNFLADLIDSEEVPKAKLGKIFRQKEGNVIIENAAKIKNGQLDLDYTQRNFVLREMPNSQAVFDKACAWYVEAARQYGIQNVILLNAYRNATQLNVNEFNLRIQEIINPSKDGELSIPLERYVKRKVKGKYRNVPVTFDFRVGDRVMQMVNRPYAKNGDVGTIRNIFVKVDPQAPDEEEHIALIAFDDGPSVEYDVDMMDDVDLAYCTTVYKSQGSEYHTVIMVASNQHTGLNNRASIYTGVTRAKENFAAITEQADHGLNGFEQSISEDAAMRYTLLAPRLASALQEAEAKMRAEEARREAEKQQGKDQEILDFPFATHSA